jgi:hypothetical protein
MVELQKFEKSDFDRLIVRMPDGMEKTLRESAKVGDSYWNCHIMSILRREWKR